MPWGLMGQERAVAALERALREGRVAHAYLFVGPERVGKHTLALKLAQALNCERAVGAGAPAYEGEERAAEPCGECSPCRRIANGIHADVQAVTVAGRYCESGDILMRDAELAPLAAGDILAMATAGAYALPMASNYNASLRPAVVLVRDGEARLARRRETYADIMRADVWPLE